MSLIAYAIPGFFILMATEWLWSRFTKQDVYRFADTLSDLSCGIMQQVATALTAVLTVPAYIVLQGNFALFDVPTDVWWTWAVCFIGVDFAYYWFHRSSHRVGVMWAAHVVHHQSEEYNLSVALRQASLQPLFSWVFYLPLALIGFPPKMFFILVGINTLYQFWIHTRLIKTLGPLEWVLNTPSHHRVHHGQNPQYIDKNHGGTLIVWDRLFGTFEPEVEPVVYGVTNPTSSWNPLYANFHYWGTLFSKARQTKRLKDKFLFFFKNPGWLPADMKEELRSPQWPPPKYDPPVAPRAAWIATLLLVAAVVATVIYLGISLKTSPGLKVALGSAVFATVVAIGILLDGRLWSYAETKKGPELKMSSEP